MLSSVASKAVKQVPRYARAAGERVDGWEEIEAGTFCIFIDRCIKEGKGVELHLSHFMTKRDLFLLEKMYWKHIILSRTEMRL